MPSPAVCSAPTVRAQGRPGSQLARHCGASRQAHGGPPAPASSFANMPSHSVSVPLVVKNGVTPSQIPSHLYPALVPKERQKESERS
ncbi:hypothetical protein Q8A67_021489 [Cirrhinus molitorella]|uniref:Uncharacterized protein n=1 Tax=Cirrhinus molitorella TaxID=172907 RepID=A0AA88PHN1_9TELE|nr:hypothetical protein Q8A67_021489 [Cirrhinus molitorella]